MDKSYCATEGCAPFDWPAFLDNPPELHSPEHLGAIGLAYRWVSCACGQQCAIIPRYDSDDEGYSPGCPIDGTLAQLGGSFATLIFSAYWSQARVTLAGIEARSAVLIAAELAKRNATLVAP